MMSSIEQMDIDLIIERVKKAIDEYRRDLEKLNNVKEYYIMLYNSPEVGAYVLLDEALKEINM